MTAADTAQSQSPRLKRKLQLKRAKFTFQVASHSSVIIPGDRRLAVSTPSRIPTGQVGDSIMGLVLLTDKTQKWHTLETRLVFVKR